MSQTRINTYRTSGRYQKSSIQANGQKITTQAVANLVGVDTIVFLFRCGNGPQHQRMRHFQRGGVWREVIV